MNIFAVLLKGNTFYDPNIMDLLEGLRQYITQDMNLAKVAQQIGAIGALLYLSIKAFSIIAGEQKFEIMSLFRPFIIALCILNFPTVLKILELPSRAIEKNLSTAVIASSEVIDRKIIVKDSLHDIMFDRMIEITNQENKDGRGIFASAASAVGMESVATIADISTNITVYEKLFFAKLSIWLQTFVITVLLGVFKGLFYSIFFLQLVLMGILAWLGPISFGFSVFGPWKDSWSHWAGKYISVSLYSALAYLTMAVALAILSYGLNQENARMATIIQTTKGGSTQKIEAFIAYVLNTDNFLGYMLIAVFATIAGIISIPVVSTWVISTTSTGGAIFNAGVKSAGAVATGGASAASAGVGAAAGAIAPATASAMAACKT